MKKDIPFFNNYTEFKEIHPKLYNIVMIHKSKILNEPFEETFPLDLSSDEFEGDFTWSAMDAIFGFNGLCSNFMLSNINKNKENYIDSYNNLVDALIYKDYYYYNNVKSKFKSKIVDRLKQIKINY